MHFKNVSSNGIGVLYESIKSDFELFKTVLE